MARTPVEVEGRVEGAEDREVEGTEELMEDAGVTGGWTPRLHPLCKVLHKRAWKFKKRQKMCTFQ